jgi:hypothetical protein
MMGWWHGATYKEYIQEELACILEGMSDGTLPKGYIHNVPIP